MRYIAIVDWPRGMQVVRLQNGFADVIMANIPFSTPGVVLNGPWPRNDPSEDVAERLARDLNRGGARSERAMREIEQWY